MNDETLNLEQAAALTGVGLETMRELIDKGVIPAARFTQKHTVIVRDQLLQCLRETAERQAAERRAPARRQPSNVSRLPQQPAKPARPNLDDYEASLTTADRPASTRADSRSA